MVMLKRQESKLYFRHSADDDHFVVFVDGVPLVAIPSQARRPRPPSASDDSSSVSTASSSSSHMLQAPRAVPGAFRIAHPDSHPRQHVFVADWDDETMFVVPRATIVIDDVRETINAAIAQGELVEAAPLEADGLIRNDLESPVILVSKRFLKRCISITALFFLSLMVATLAALLSVHHSDTHREVPPLTGPQRPSLSPSLLSAEGRSESQIPTIATIPTASPPTTSRDGSQPTLPITGPKPPLPPVAPVALAPVSRPSPVAAPARSPSSGVSNRRPPTAKNPFNFTNNGDGDNSTAVYNGHHTGTYRSYNITSSKGDPCVCTRSGNQTN